MKTKNKNAMYNIDSCHEKIKCLTNDVCNRPSYHTVCYRPIVDRNLLTHSDYLKMLSTPRGFKWTDEPLYYKKGYNSYRFRKQENEKYNANGQQKMSYTKICSSQNKTINNQKQKKIIDIVSSYNKYYKSKKKQNRRNNTSKRDNKSKTKNINTNEHGMGDDLKQKNDSLFLKDEDNSHEKLAKLKEQQEADYYMRQKKKLWLKDEKRRQKREEKENKFKSSIQAKQKEQEERKKNQEEKIKMKIKQEQILEEERKQKIEIEKENLAKAKEIAEKKLLEENDILTKEAERQLRIEALLLEEKRIVEEEEAWRKKVNQEFAQKMGFTMNSNIRNWKNEHSMCNSDKKSGKKIQYIDKILKEIKQNNQVFDPGNLMKQIIKQELNKAENKKVKRKRREQVCEPCDTQKKNMTMIIKNEEKKEKLDSSKNIVLQKCCGFNNIINSKNSNYRAHKLTMVKSYENCILNKPKNVLNCKIPDVHSYSNTSFNTLVCRWKNEVTDMIANMHKRRYNCVQNGTTRNTRKHSTSYF